MSNSYVDVPVYLQVEPRERRWNRLTQRYDGDTTKAVVVATTTKRPAKPKGGTVTVKVTLRIPTAVFDPLRPEAIVIIPESMIQPNPVTVEATDPQEES